MSVSFMDSLENRTFFSTTSGTVVASGGSTIVYNVSTTAPLTRLQGSTLYVDGAGGADSIVAKVSGNKLSFTGGIANTKGTSGSVLFTTGSDGTIRVINADGSANGSVTVVKNANGTVTLQSLADAASSKSYDLSKIKKVVVSTGGGDDTVDLSQLAVPAEVHGGDGADDLTGGAGNDTLYGDGGYDQLYGGRGTDLLVGGGGADRLVARFGPDTLFGQGGDDRLYAYTAKAVLNGGGGTDDGFAAAAPDSVANIERTFSNSPLSLEIRGTVLAASRTTATLARDGRGLSLTANVPVLDGSDVDFDLVKNSRGEVVVDATVYAPQARTGKIVDLTRTFALGGNLSPHVIKATVNITAGFTVAGRAIVTPAFDAETFGVDIADDGGSIVFKS